MIEIPRDLSLRSQLLSPPTRGIRDRPPSRASRPLYNSTQLAGYVVCGSTGEANLLTWAKRKDFLPPFRNARQKESYLLRARGSIRSGRRFGSKRAGELGYYAAGSHAALLQAAYDAGGAARIFLAVADASPSGDSSIRFRNSLVCEVQPRSSQLNCAAFGIL